MIDFIKERINKIKETKKYANEHNVHNWFNIVLHSIIFCLILGLLLTMGTVLFMDDLESNSISLKGSLLMKLLWDFTNLSPLIFAFIIAISIMDKIIRIQVRITERINKKIMGLWQSFDMWYFKKYRKHSPLTEWLAKLQEKANKHQSKLTRKHKKLATVIIIGLIIALQIMWRIPPLIEEIENTQNEMKDTTLTVENPINEFKQEEKQIEVEVNDKS